MTQDLFLGRTEEQQQFRRVLRSYIPNWVQRHLPTFSKPFVKSAVKRDVPFLLLFHGEGGMGKTSLMRRLRRIVETEPAFTPEFQLLFLDWESQQKVTQDLNVGHDYIRPETVLQVLHKVMVDAGWGGYFESYRKWVQEIQKVEAKVEKELRSQPNPNLPKEASNLGAKGIALMIRTAAAFNPATGLLDQVAGAKGLETTVEKTLNVSAEALHQTRQFVQKALTPQDYATYAQPQERLAEAMGKGMAELAKRKPLVVLLDTYEIVDRPECDYALRTVIRCSGSRVVWAIAGRSNLADSEKRGSVYVRGYRRDFPEDRVYARGMKEFSLEEIQQYFSERVPDRPLNAAEAEALAAFSLGIPFVISEAAAMWREGKPIAEIVEPVAVQFGSTTAYEQVVKATSERFLVHCFGAQERERDLRSVYGLAMMRRPDVELLKAMLDVTDLEQELQALRERYSFIWVERVRLDEKLAGFVREYLLAEVRRTSPMVQQMNDRAIVWLQLHLEDLSREIGNRAEQLWEEGIAESIADLVYHYFWRSEEAGWRYLMPRFVEGWQYDRSWTRGVLEFVERFMPMMGREGKRRLKLMIGNLTASPEPEETEALLADLEKLAQRKWLDGAGAEDRQTILKLQKGKCLHRQGKYTEALQIYLEIEERLPSQLIQLKKDLAAEFYALSSKFIWSKSNITPTPSVEGEVAINKAIALNPQQSDYYCKLSVALYASGKYKRAIAGCQEAIQLDPKNAYAYFMLGNALQAQNRLEEAIAAYQKAIEINPNYAISYNSLGIALSAQNRLEEAIVAYRKAIELNSTYATAYNNLGIALSAQNRLEEAIAAYRKVIELNPTYTTAYNNLGIALKAQNRLEEAIAVYQKAIELNPTYAGAYNNLGIAYNNLGITLSAQNRLEEAIVAYRKAIELNPTYATAYNNLGIALKAQNRLEEAIAAYRKAIELNPDDVTASNNLGNALKAQNHLEEAIVVYQKAIELNPDDATACNRYLNQNPKNQSLLWNLQKMWSAACRAVRQISLRMRSTWKVLDRNE